MSGNKDDRFSLLCTKLCNIAYRMNEEDPISEYYGFDDGAYRWESGGRQVLDTLEEAGYDLDSFRAALNERVSEKFAARWIGLGSVSPAMVAAEEIAEARAARARTRRQIAEADAVEMLGKEIVYR